MNPADKDDKKTGRGRAKDKDLARRPHPGSERHADEQRDVGGPRYHGEGWDRADDPAEQKRIPSDEPPAVAPDDVEPAAQHGVSGPGRVDAETDASDETP